MQPTQTAFYAGITIALLVGLGLGLTLDLTGGIGMKDGRHMMPGGATMDDSMMSASDQHFIVQMIPHHEGAIDMARLAQERSKRPEILSLANGIIEAQEREIADMRSWYQDWYGSAPPPGGMGMHMGGMSGGMEALRTAPDADFDGLFITQMIPHHEMAVMMAQMIVSSERPEMRTLANNVITSQSREIEMMRSWLKAWYPSN